MFSDIIKDDQKIKIRSRRFNRYGKTQLQLLSKNSSCLSEAWSEAVKSMTKELGDCYKYIKKLEDKR